METNKKELKECKYCKSLIAADAKICPVCKKRQESTAKKVALGLLIGLMIISIIGLIFFSGDNDNQLEYTEKDTYQEETPTTENNPPKTPQSNLILGQSHDFSGIELTVNNISEWEGDDFNKLPSGYLYLMINITIKNNTREEKNPFDIMFTGYVDGQNIDQEFIGDNALSGNELIPNTYTNGDISFIVPSNWNTFQLRAEDWANDETVVYDLNRSQVTTNGHDDHHENDN